MTMKTKKTLQHIAAVAVVLLTLCLVFAAPVSAEEESIAYLNGTAYNTIEEAIDASVTDGDVLRLPYHGYTFTNVSGVFYADAEEQTGRMMYMSVSDNSGSETKLYYYGISEESKRLTEMLSDVSYGAPIQDGDIIILPIGTINVAHSGGCGMKSNATIVGAGIDKTIVKVSGDNSGNKRLFQPYTRGNAETPLSVVYKNMELEYTGSGVAAAFYISLGKQNIFVTVENVVVKNFDTAFGGFANNGDAGDVGIELSLDGVSTSGNQKTIDFHIHKDYDTFIHLNYDENTCSFDDLGDVKYGDVSYTTWNDDDNAAPYFHGNMLINGEDITLGSAVAQIGDNYYGTLAEAVGAAKAGDTVTLLADITDSKITVDKSITIDGNGHTFTTGGKTGLYLKNSSEGVEKITVTLQNLNVVATHYPVYIGSKVDLTIKDGSKLSGYSAIYLSNYSGETEVNDASGSKVTILNSELIGENSADEGTSSNFGTIAIQANDTVVDVQNSKLVAKATGTANQSILRFGADSATSPFENAKVTIGGNSVIELDNANFMSVGTGSDFTGISQQIIGAGVTANFNPSAYIASGMEVVQPGDKYLVQEYVDRSSSSSSSVKPEEPEQPEEPVVEPETPAAPGEVASSTEVTDGGEVAFETTVVDDETGEQSAPAAADSEIKGVVLPTGTEGTVEFVPVSEQPAPAGQEENTKRVFEINVPSYKKGEAAVIKFQMTVAELAADGKEAADVALWHFDEETGEWTKLVTTFTIVDGVVYFEAITEDFSPFAIIYEDEPAGDMPGDEPQDEPETPESPAPVLGLLAALGAAVVLRRK